MRLIVKVKGTFMKGKSEFEYKDCAKELSWSSAALDGTATSRAAGRKQERLSEPPLFASLGLAGKTAEQPVVPSVRAAAVHLVCRPEAQHLVHTLLIT